MNKTRNIINTKEEAYEMKKRLIVIGLLGIVLIGSFSGCVGLEMKDYFNGEYPVDAQTIVSVLNINGAIEIIGWGGDNVTVSAVKTSTFGEEELRKINISVTQTQNHLKIETKYTGQKLIQCEVDYSLKVPYNTTIETLTTSNGAIQISNVKGDISATSSNGAVGIENVDGVVSVMTSNGHIEIQNTTGIGNLRTSNAAITAEVHSILDDVSIETSNGAVTVYVNPLLNATFEMTTSNAKVQLEGITLNVSLFENTHVIGTLGTDGPKVDIHSSNANIYLYKLQFFKFL
jgi:hypothetical protein